MPLESGTTIADLSPSDPLGGDVVSKGDDHLRLIKSVLQTQFPGALGAGFNTPILASESELNYLQGLTSNVQDQLDAVGLRIDGLEDTLSAPSGTVLTFFQASAPLGWTQNTSIGLDNSMLRTVSTAGGGSGGTNDPTIMDRVPPHTHVADGEGAHTHSMNPDGGQNFFVNGSSPTTAGVQGDVLVNMRIANNTGAGSSHTHNISANTGGSATNWTPKYVNMILCEKD